MKPDGVCAEVRDVHVLSWLGSPSHVLVICHEKDALQEPDSLRGRKNPAGRLDGAQLSPRVPKVTY